MADNEEIVVTSAAAIIAVAAARRLRRRRQRSCWVRSWMLRRPQRGTYRALSGICGRTTRWHIGIFAAWTLIGTRNCWRWSLQQ